MLNIHNVIWCTHKCKVCELVTDMVSYLAYGILSSNKISDNHVCQSGYYSKFVI